MEANFSVFRALTTGSLLAEEAKNGEETCVAGLSLLAETNNSHLAKNVLFFNLNE